jgi:UDP-N-acetylmuramate dehydrogenase
MNATASIPRDFRDALPTVKGRIAFDAPLARFTWFGVGGPADVLFRPADVDDLASFLAALPDDVPVWPLGVGSNVIIRDGGVRGVAILLRAGFANVDADDDLVVAGAGALAANVARRGADAGLGGLEFMSGVPGSVGGAVRMNAGAYGGEVRDVLVSAEVVTRDGKILRLNTDDLGFAYRHSDLAVDDIVVRAAFRGVEDDPALVRQRLLDVQTKREESQPLRSRTGGSTFRNPEGCKAWELIDAAGCRGMRIGGAQVSEKHCNFLIALYGATAADIEALGQAVHAAVKQSSGIDLHWEIKRVGRPLPEGGA